MCFPAGFASAAGKHKSKLDLNVFHKSGKKRKKSASVQRRVQVTPMNSVLQGEANNEILTFGFQVQLIIESSFFFFEGGGA